MSQCVLPFETCREKIKVKCLKIPKTKLIQFDPDEKNYWRPAIREVEKLAKQKAQETKIKRYDLSTSLPVALYKRVSKIIPLIPIEADTFDDEQKKEDEVEEIHRKKEEGSFHESEMTEVIEEGKEFKPVELRLEPIVDRNKHTKKKESWFSEYIVKRRKDRIKWQSRIYKLEKDIKEKPLYEQAEHLMDSAAERFTEWVNSLSDNKDTDISKDLLKELFSLESGSGPLAGIHIEPKQVKAVPNAVAETWNLPEKSLELKLEGYLKKRKKAIKKRTGPKVAFGRTLPQNLQKWIPSDADTVVQPVFPKELLTRETIFKGIGHLRSTRALIDFYKRHTRLPRPQYLVDSGYFKEKEKKVAMSTVPLYELLKI